MAHHTEIYFETEVADKPAVCALIERCAKQTLALEQVDFDTRLEVTVVDAAEIRALNAAHRQKDSVTDVLSFPMYEFLNGEPQEQLEAEPDSDSVLLGDMVLCYERALTQAEEYGHSAARECGYLTVHSVLHLLGYDHERGAADAALMRQKEEAVLSSLALTREEE